MARFKELEAENAKLKKMYAEERLKAEIIQETNKNLGILQSEQSNYLDKNTPPNVLESAEYKNGKKICGTPHSLNHWKGQLGQS